MKEILLCRPCAEELKAKDEIEIKGSNRDKDTCEHCGRRRFVYRCTKNSQTKLNLKNKKSS